MTMIKNFDIKCAMCDHTSSQRVLMSTNSWGYADLDFRPAEMQRSTMGVWVMECPNCGYVASYLDKETELSEDFIKSEEYKTCGGIGFESELAQRFYRKYLISAELDMPYIAFLDILHCAWACDDEKDTENARLARKIASDLADILIKSEHEDKITIVLIRADLLRRSGEFERLISEYESVTLNEDIPNRAIRFHIEKAMDKDDGCYTFEEFAE